MIEHRIKGNPIQIGFEWRQRVKWATAMFDVASSIVAHLRLRNTDDQPLAVLSTANGRLIIPDDKTIEIVVPYEVTATLPPGAVVTSLVRTDTPTPAPLGIRLWVPVILSPTRPPL